MQSGSFLETRQVVSPVPSTLRDFVAILFRQRRLMALAFASVIAGTLIGMVLLPRRYESEIKFLVKSARVDSLPGENNAAPPGTGVTEEVLNSEIELLKDDDVLQAVVVSTGLDRKRWHLGKADGPSDIADAVRQLRSDLKVDSPKKTNIIEVRYTSTNPKLAAQVLDKLANVYIEKHLEVHRSPGEYDFFDQQAEHYKQLLDHTEAQIAANKIAVPQLMRDLSAQKLSDLKANLAQTKVARRETERRINALEREQVQTPARVTTQVRLADNGQLLQQLRTTLLNLKLKREELLSKYEPTYRPVQEVARQIATTEAAIDEEERRPMKEHVTDENPTEQWITSELAKVRVERDGYRAREQGIEEQLAAYERNTKELDESAAAQEGLLRNAKSAEQNYLLYSTKREEARISEALDKRRILNVAVAEEPHAPILPIHSRSNLFVVGIFLAVGMAAIVGFVADRHATSFRTPAEVVQVLEMPILAALPERRYGRDELTDNSTAGQCGFGAIR